MRHAHPSPTRESARPSLEDRLIAKGKGSIYACPIKPLVNEKFMALCRAFGPDNVGLPGLGLWTVDSGPWTVTARLRTLDRTDGTSKNAREHWLRTHARIKPPERVACQFSLEFKIQSSEFKVGHSVSSAM